MSTAAEPIALALPRAAVRTRARRNTALIVGLVIVGFWAGVAAFAPWIAPHSPLDLDVMNRLEPPKPGHWFGTDEVGRDNFSRVMWGARITIPLSFAVIVVASLFGAGIGAVAGYAGGRVDEVLMRVVDVV